jgi:hypothetical protein
MVIKKTTFWTMVGEFKVLSFECTKIQSPEFSKHRREGRRGLTLHLRASTSAGFIYLGAQKLRRIQIQAYVRNDFSW